MATRFMRSWNKVDFCERLAALNVKQGAEIGVLEGAFSEVITRGVPGLHMYLVDPWMFDPAWEDIANLSQEVQDLRHQLVKAKFPTHTVIRKTSKEASKDIENGSLDFVYIDARHDEVSITEDIELWYPKLRKGGMLSGHDYDIGHAEILNAVNSFAMKVNKNIIIFSVSGIWVIE